MFSNHKESIPNKNLNPKELGSYLKTNLSNVLFFKLLIFKKFLKQLCLYPNTWREKKKNLLSIIFKKWYLLPIKFQSQQVEVWEIGQVCPQSPLTCFTFKGNLFNPLWFYIWVCPHKTSQSWLSLLPSPCTPFPPNQNSFSWFWISQDFLIS